MSNPGPPNFRSMNLGLGLVYDQFMVSVGSVRVSLGLEANLIERKLGRPGFDTSTKDRVRLHGRWKERTVYRV